MDENSVEFTAYNQAVEDAKAAIRAESQGGGYWAAAYINAITRRCSPHVYVNRVAAASPVAPVEQSEPQYVTIDGERRMVVPCPDGREDCEVLHTVPAPSAATPDEAQTGGFTCDCCGRNMEVRINGKFCNECAGYRAAASSTHARAAAEEIVKSELKGSNTLQGECDELPT